MALHKRKLRFLAHAEVRARQRCSLSTEDIIDLLVTEKCFNVGSRDNREHWLFYDRKADRCFVAVVADKCFIITVLGMIYHASHAWVIPESLQDIAKARALGDPSPVAACDPKDLVQEQSVEGVPVPPEASVYVKARRVSGGKSVESYSVRTKVLGSDEDLLESFRLMVEAWFPDEDSKETDRIFIELASSKNQLKTHSGGRAYLGTWSGDRVTFRKREI